MSGLGPARKRQARRRRKMRRRRRYTVVDLFSGPGGTSHGFLKAGYRVIGAVEVDKSAAETYRRNIKVPVHEMDIRDLSPKQFRKDLGLRKRELDVLVGCPPCQGFTRLRNRNGAGDHRNSLVLRYLEFVKEFAPRFAVFENVPGLRRTRHGKVFYTRLTKGLENLGYSVACNEVDAANYGVPQRRVRIILIASRSGPPPRLKPETHGEPASEDVMDGRKKAWITTRFAIGCGKLKPVRPGATAGRDKNHVAANTGLHVLKFLKRVPKDGGSRHDVPRRYWLKCHRKHDGHYDTYGRLTWDAPSNTITSGCTNPSKGRFVHPTQARALTIREAALLQGFPSRYRFRGTSQAEQVGNAVPPQLALIVAKSLKNRLRRPA